LLPLVSLKNAITGETVLPYDKTLFVFSIPAGANWLFKAGEGDFVTIACCFAPTSSSLFGA